VNDAPPAYLRIGKRRLRIPKRRGIRIALGIVASCRPPATFCCRRPSRCCRSTFHASVAGGGGWSYGGEEDASGSVNK
jgi:hypothetical protein